MRGDPTPRGSLSVAALLVMLLLPLAVGWAIERAAYGDVKATENAVAPLRAAVPMHRVKAPPEGTWSNAAADVEAGEAQPETAPH